MAGRNTSSWIVGIAGLAIGVVIVLRFLIPNGMDPTMFLTLGEDKPIQRAYAERMLGDVEVRPGAGHDGKFFFAQANDPWFLEPERHAAVLDRPIYRGERMLYPMLAGGLGLFPPGVVVWSLIVTNLLAMGMGSLFAAKLAVLWGASPWLGLAVPLNVGLIFEVAIDGAGVLAYTCCLAGLYALLKGRSWVASLSFAAAALSRDVMIAFIVGVFILYWVESRPLPWRILVTPLVAMSVWYLHLQFRLMGMQGLGGGTRNFGLPLVGFIEATRAWIAVPRNAILSLAILAVIVLFVPLTLRSRLPIAFGALPFVALAVFLSVNVWREPFDLSRALAPVFTAAPFLLFVRADERLAHVVGARR